ncbi:hypothetical protein [Gilvimarinus algae]|uniref:SMODS-associating 2TM beta-strand rich effector domain-containing protein n=1 Tax=Gilvimarinus algae TaxID=3058037 RepID=A0ABT8TEK7_9GAMM|nr:hypothetical protein [Gilvimarinus sp. SDUM040014]MDO3382395.1 hypothetical protein [Gilvimarinus sp. SDUM040014]
MANIALSINDFKKALLFVTLTTITIGGIVGLVRQFGFGDDSLKALTLGLASSVSWAIAASVWAFRRPWTVEFLARWSGRPIIHGVWFGSLYTNYDTSSSDSSNAIPIAFVIKQTYLGYSLLSYTENRESQTLMEALSVDDQHSTVHLRYMYEFYIRKPKERKLITGAAELKLIEAGSRLKGHYLTNSPTQGFVDLNLIQRDCNGIDTFGAAQKLYIERKAHRKAEEG